MRSLSVLSGAVLAALLMSSVSTAAQDKPAQNSAGAAGLGDMMLILQLRHAKVWYAAQVRNWALAEYELGQLDANLKETMRRYASVLAANAAGTDKLAAAVAESIKSKDPGRFRSAFAQLTTACNACHEAMGRAFIYIKTPTLPSPYSNQLYRPGER